MAKLKSYSCTKCAGVLNYDEEQELFGCPFCGNEFNLVEIHREELTGQAESAMRRLRFDTAKDNDSNGRVRVSSGLSPRLEVVRKSAREEYMETCARIAVRITINN